MIDKVRILIVIRMPAKFMESFAKLRVMDIAFVSLVQIPGGCRTL